MADDYSREIAELALRRASLALTINKPNPDAAGQANRVARATGLPAATVDDNLSILSQQVEVARTRSLLERHPPLASWMGNVRNAAVASDDVDHLAETSKIWSQARTPATPASQQPKGSRASYLGTSLLSGLHSVTGAVLGLLDQVNPWTTSVEDIYAVTEGNPAWRERLLHPKSVWTGATSALSRTARSEGDKSRSVMSRVSKADQDRFGSLVYGTTDPKRAAYLSPTRITADALQSLPSTAVLAVTAFLTRGASLRAEAAATAAGATEIEAATIGVRAAQKMAVRVGATGEGALGYQTQKDQTRAEIEAMPFERLNESPEYQLLRKSGLDPATVRMALAATAGQRAGIGAGLVDAITNGASGPILGKIIGEGGNVVRRAGKGFATEAIQEAVQSGGEQIAGNMTVRDANPHQGIVDGVVESMLQGAVVGGVSAAAVTSLVGKSAAAGRRLAESERSADLLTRAMDSAANSKVKLRDRDAFRDLIELHTRDTPMENVFVSADVAWSYFEAGMELTE